MAKKCRQCGLVNWEYEEVCQRCSASLNQATPGVYPWFVAYCILAALLNLTFAVLGIALMFTEPDPDMSAVEAKTMSSLFLILGLVFFVPTGGSILATSEMGLGVWACAHLPRANQHLLFARMYSSIDILVETRDEGVLR